MHIISEKKLRSFWEIHPDAKTPLKTWFQILKKHQPCSFQELRNIFRSVDRVEDFTIFDIGGNKYRLITLIIGSRIYIKEVLTHAEYSKDNWKKRLGIKS